MIKRSHVKLIAMVTMPLAGVALIILSLLHTTRENNHIDIKKYGGIYRYAHSEVMSTLDPRRAIFSVALNSVLLIFDPLIKVSDDMKLVPSICSDWEMVNNGFTFLCHVRPNVYFHNRAELTSSDVSFSLYYIAQSKGLDGGNTGLSMIKGINDYWNGHASTITGIRIVDKYTLAIDLEQSCPHFAYIIASPRYVVFPSDFNGEDKESFFLHPVGTGPFKFISLRDNNMDVSANELYFNGRPYIDGLKLVYYRTKNDAVRAFADGKVDDLTYYRIAELPPDISDGHYKYRESYVSLIVFPNNSRKPFNDENMRRLLFSVIDRKNLLEKCYPTSRVSETIIPRGIIGSNDDAPKILYNLEYALKLVHTMRSDNIKIAKATIYAIEADVNQCAADHINNNIEMLKLPWRFEITSTENLAKFFFNGSMDAEIEEIGVKNEDAYSLLRFFGSDSPENLARIKDDKIDGYLREVRFETDPLKRTMLYRAIDSQIVRMNYAMPIGSPVTLSIQSNAYRYENHGATKVVQDFTRISLR